MTAKELIKKLSKLDPETRIFARGYEGGYEDAKNDFDINNYALDVNTAWYYGSHQKLDKKEKKPEGKIIVKGICL